MKKQFISCVIIIMTAILFMMTCSGCFAQVVVITHKAYQIHFDTKLHEPIYTHYILTKSMLGGTIKRKSFTKDPLIDKNLQGSLSDYKGFDKIYDKGHLSDFDDFSKTLDLSLESMYDTNIAPQASLFNEGIWLTLEKYGRLLAQTYDVEIWTGCIYEGSTTKVGSLVVPTFYWKIYHYNGIYEAFKMPNLATTKGSISNFKVDYRTLLPN